MPGLAASVVARARISKLSGREVTSAKRKLEAGSVMLRGRQESGRRSAQDTETGFRQAANSTNRDAGWTRFCAGQMLSILSQGLGTNARGENKLNFVLGAAPCWEPVAETRLASPGVGSTDSGLEHGGSAISPLESLRFIQCYVTGIYSIHAVSANATRLDRLSHKTSSNVGGSGELNMSWSSSS